MTSNLQELTLKRVTMYKNNLAFVQREAAVQASSQVSFPPLYHRALFVLNINIEEEKQMSNVSKSEVTARKIVDNAWIHS